jgi:signal transduction histidine kinase
MGLEMFVARETIHAHQGEIIVESGLGQGTAFHMYLPAAAES